MPIVIGMVVVALLAGSVFRALPDAEMGVSQRAAATPSAASAYVYFRNCREARAAGVAPIARGRPGYRSQLDADDDGWACEPYPVN
jgi:hypothetical protein